MSGPMTTAPATKLACLWASLMSLYIYNDYFSLYLPGTVEMVSAGRFGSLGPATDMVLVVVAMLLAVPALMISLSVLLPPPASRWLNVVVGAFYTVVETWTLSRPALFYQIVVGLEILVTGFIAIYALRWRAVEGRGVGDGSGQRSSGASL